MRKSPAMAGPQSWSNDLAGGQLQLVPMVFRQRSRSTETTFPTIWWRYRPEPTTTKHGPETVGAGANQLRPLSVRFHCLLQRSAASVHLPRPDPALHSHFTSMEPILCPAATSFCRISRRAYLMQTGQSRVSAPRRFELTRFSAPLHTHGALKFRIPIARRLASFNSMSWLPARQILQ